MSTAVLDSTVSQAALRVRCAEAAIHRPLDWTVLIDSTQRLPVHIDLDTRPGEIHASFVAGPMPDGEHQISLEFDGEPMYVGVKTFARGQWWRLTITASIN